MVPTDNSWWDDDAQEEWLYAATRDSDAENDDTETALGVPTRDTRTSGISVLRTRCRNVQRREKKLAEARAELYAQAAQLADREGWSVRRIATAMNVTNKTAHEWIKAGRLSA